MANNSDKLGQGSKEGTNDRQNTHRQIVIARDQKVQHGLQMTLGNSSLVFTILQSKGMEYDDVFLFDFFSSSPCLSDYRSLGELLGHGGNPGYGETHMVCSSISDQYGGNYALRLLIVGQSMCSELKVLCSDYSHRYYFLTHDSLESLCRNYSPSQPIVDPGKWIKFHSRSFHDHGSRTLGPYQVFHLGKCMSRKSIIHNRRELC